MDRFAHLQTFVAVAEAESFTVAAESLGLSRAMASKHVQTLEDHLGIRLLQRTTRRVRLTEAGRRYLDRTKRLLGDLEEAEDEARGERTAPRGALRVNGPVSFSQAHLAAAIPAFLERFPDVSVDLTVNDRTVDLLEEGYDVAVRIGRLADSSLVARRLAPVRLLLGASPDYLASHPAPQTPDDLRDHACLGYAYSADGGLWRFTHADGTEAVVTPKSRFTANNGEVLTEAALAGTGIVLQPDFVLGPHFASGALIRLMPDWRHPELAVHAVHHQSRYVAAKIRAFIDHLAETWRHAPWKVD